MKTGYLLRTFPQLSQTFVNNEITGLGQLGHDVVIAALYPPGEEIPESLISLASRALYWFDIDKSRLIEILKANAVLALKFPTAYLKLFKKHVSSPSSFLKKIFLAHYFHTAGVSHIHTHFAWEQVAYLSFIKQLTGIPFSVTLHAADIYSEICGMTEAAEDAAFLITISEYNKHYLVNNLGIDSKKIHVVHCGVNTDARPVPHGSLSENQGNNLPFILSIGRLTQKKGFDLFLEALKRLKENGVAFKARIIGDGPLMPELRAQIKASGLEQMVDLPGAMPHESVMAAVRDCHLFVLACRRAKNGDIDGIPVVLMEAMAAAKPVISTSLSGIPELVQPGTGLLVPPEDPEKLTRAMVTVLENRENAHKMGRKARQVVEQSFSIQGQVQRLIHLIQDRN